MGLKGRMGRLLETPGARARREAAERLKAEELKAEELKRAKHNAWLKCHVALCSEVAAPGRVRKADLTRWISRLGGTNVLGYACLQDLKEMVYLGLHFEEARAILRLAVATNAVALRVDDEDVVAAQAKVEVEVEGGADGAGERTAKNAKDAKGEADGGEMLTYIHRRRGETMFGFKE